MGAHNLLGTSEISVSRSPEGVNDAGRLSVGAASELLIQARVQPKADGLEQYQAYSQEHRLSTLSAIALYTDEPLQPQSADGLTPADRLTYKGRLYVVVACDDLRESVLPHCRSVALEQLDGES